MLHYMPASRFSEGNQDQTPILKSQSLQCVRMKARAVRFDPPIGFKFFRD